MPGLPDGELPLSASVEQDGIRVTLALERNPMPVGEPTWLKVEVQNLARDDLVYADDCFLVGVFGTVEGAAWRPGIEFAGRTADYKAWAIESFTLQDGTIHLGFTPEPAVNQGLEIGEYGCADVLISARLASEEIRSERARWSGFSMRSNAPPPGGLVRLVGRFSFYWRDAEGQAPPGAHERVIEVPLDAWLAPSADAPLVQPTEAIDIALSDGEFGSWVLGRPLRNGADWRLRYDPSTGVWYVGLESYYPEPRTREVLIDGLTGDVIRYQGPTD